MDWAPEQLAALAFWHRASERERRAAAESRRPWPPPSTALIGRAGRGFGLGPVDVWRGRRVGFDAPTRIGQLLRVSRAV